MGDQETTSNKGEIYSIVAIGIIGFFLGLYFLIINRNGINTTPITQIETSHSNNILEGLSLPPTCTKALDIIDCISRSMSGENESIKFYRQKITSERNIIESAQLQATCDTQLQYLQSLSGINIPCL